MRAKRKIFKEHFIKEDKQGLLKLIRKKIDRVDAEILEKLNERFRLALEASRYKVSLRDKQREKEVLENVKERAAELDCLRVSFALELYRRIIREGLSLQEEKAEEEKRGKERGYDRKNEANKGMKKGGQLDRRRERRN